MSSNLAKHTQLAVSIETDRRHTVIVFEAESLVLFLVKSFKLSLTHILLFRAPGATWLLYFDYMVSVSVFALVKTHVLLL